MESSRLSELGVFQTVRADGVVKRKELDSFGGHGQSPGFILCAMGKRGKWRVSNRVVKCYDFYFFLKILFIYF